MVLVGYIDLTTTQYKCWDKKSRRIFVSRDVTVVERVREVTTTIEVPTSHAERDKVIPVDKERKKWKMKNRALMRRKKMRTSDRTHSLSVMSLLWLRKGQLVALLV